ncbi:hypothetical protein Pmani_015121 [Petrolisthes manimaculis]|uniref:Uncharacterized protein n=1 Tax=Petrolisthes manimaculis TaxID=1843537 RepID=A0AAE1UCB9_9EUCA|nr:hypothetical protein Pmani_015121 [Petrolisthes manimaculis]
MSTNRILPAPNPSPAPLLPPTTKLSVSSCHASTTTTTTNDQIPTRHAWLKLSHHQLYQSLNHTSYITLICPSKSHLRPLLNDPHQKDS